MLDLSAFVFEFSCFHTSYLRINCVFDVFFSRNFLSNAGRVHALGKEGIYDVRQAFKMSKQKGVGSEMEITGKNPTFVE